MHYLLIFLLTSFIYSAPSITAGGTGAPDHAQWNSVLQRHVSSDGLVDYVAVKRDRQFTEYLMTLSGTHPDDTWTRDEKMSYWINAYNAFTLKLVSDNLPLKSIKDLKDPWGLEFIEIEGKRYSLNTIEHEILRKEFKDPRIHFALCCASIGCPPLYNRAFLANRLDSQLEKVTRSFIGDENYNSITVELAELSSIFDWYSSDFDRGGGVMKFVNRYSNVKLKAGGDIRYRSYDWNLNGR